MGKGSRIKDNSVEQQNMSNEKKKAKRRRNKKIIIISVCIALAVCIAAGGAAFGVVNNLVKTGYYLRNTQCVASDNYAVNNAALSYYFNVVYSEFRDDNKNQLVAMGVDTGKPLKEQKCTFYDGYDTWYDYIMEQVQNRITNIICYANAAKAEGLELDNNDNSRIDNRMDELKSAAQSANKSLDEYISDVYGRGVNESDIRGCLELSKLSQKYYAKSEASLNYTDAELEKQYSKNSKKYDVVSYKSYTFESDRADIGTNNQTLREFLKNAKSNAEKLKNAGSVAEFDSVLKSYLTDYYKARGKNVTDAEINGEIKKTLTENYEYTAGREAASWAFDDARKVGDTYMTENEEENTYTVYILVTARHRYDYITKNVRHILLSADTYDDNTGALSAAETVLDKILASSDVEASFIENAKKYSEDVDSGLNGGLYENISKGETVTQFDEWCYYSGRKRGDTAVIKTDYGYHVMYFAGNGLKKWQADAANDLKAEDFKKLIEKLTAKYNVKFDADAAYKLNM